MTKAERIETLHAIQANGVMLHLAKAFISLVPNADTSMLDDALHLHNLTIEELSKAEVDEDKLDVLIQEMERFKARIDNLRK